MNVLLMCVKNVSGDSNDRDEKDKNYGVRRKQTFISSKLKNRGIFFPEYFFRISEFSQKLSKK